MPFADFVGNGVAVRRLRESLAFGRLPHSMILAGPRGAGKYTLSLMLAQAANCLARPLTDNLPDFCGICSNCTRIALSANREARFAEAVAAREELREVDKKETRILIQTHPDILIIPPDPPQLLIKLGQVRTVVREVYRVPAEAQRAFYIFTSGAWMKEAANSLLKVLEEPPLHATLILLTPNPQELLPTIRSRASIFHLSPLTTEEMESLLASRRPELKGSQRALIARLAQGAVGRAVGFDLDAYLAGRLEALTLLRTAIPDAARDADWGALFRITEAFRAGAEGQQKTERLLQALSGLLEDLLMLQSGAAGLLRNVDIADELRRLAAAVPFSWIEQATRALQQVESGMRRNLLRSLALDAFAAIISNAPA